MTKHTTCFDVGGLEFEIYAGAQVHTLRAGNASEKAMYVVVMRWPETRRPHNRAQVDPNHQRSGSSHQWQLLNGVCRATRMPCLGWVV